jgi:hypothetical protein
MKLRRQRVPLVPFANSFRLLLLSKQILPRAVRPYLPTERWYTPRLPFFLKISDWFSDSMNTMALPLLRLLSPALFAMPHLAAVLAQDAPPVPWQSQALAAKLLLAPANRPTGAAPPVPAFTIVETLAPSFRQSSRTLFTLSSAHQHQPPFQIPPSRSSTSHMASPIPDFPCFPQTHSIRPPAPMMVQCNQNDRARIIPRM